MTALRVYQADQTSGNLALSLQEYESDWRILDYPGGRIVMRATNAVEKRWRLNACQKEPWTVAWLETLGPGAKLWNIGACVGSYALIAAYRGAQVVAVEANLINAARMAENVARNGLGERVTVVPAACSATEMPLRLHLPHSQAGAAGLQILPQAAPQWGGRCVGVPSVTLDGLAEAHGYPTHLLIDVDGAEVDVLRGGPETLARVQSVLLESKRDPAIAAACVQLLEAGGLAMVGGWDQRNGAPIDGVIYSQWERRAA